MPRRPDVKCAECGRTIWRGTGSRPEGEATCRPCREAKREAKREASHPLRICPTCSETFRPRTTRQVYCRAECRPARTTKGSTVARGYGGQHQRIRERWRIRMVEDGEQVDCHADVCFMPTRLIDPEQPWDLGHTRDRTGWTGPEHRRCNRKEPQLR